MAKRILSKASWKDAIGATKTPKRLKLLSHNGLFICPVACCESEPYRSKRGCRKHVFTKHGWYYYFEEKPDIAKVFPEFCTRANNYQLPKRVRTSNMPMFLKTCVVGVNFKKWLQSCGGGGKGESQADQLLCKVLKYLKYCCADVSLSWDIPESVVDYCLGSVTMISDFAGYLQTDWSLKSSDVTGYMNALGHLLDFRRSYSDLTKIHSSVFIPSEIYIHRVKRYLSKKMKSDWREVLSVDYLNSINCWVKQKVKRLQKVIPYHSEKYKQIILYASSPFTSLAAHDLSFATSFILAALFLPVKASRPMTYQFLTVQMVESIDENGIIDQTIFKTKEKYGFDSLIFSDDVLTLIKNYINFIRPRLNQCCDYVLICRNGKQISKLSNIFGRVVFLAIGKYINPTRYRQIIETESAEKLTVDEQTCLSEDQKHTSNVAKIHYQKLRSENIAMKVKSCLEKLQDSSKSSEQLAVINKATHSSNKIDFEKVEPRKQGLRQKKTTFSDNEDNFIRKGISKYGYGRWTSILNDPSFKFHPSREPCTLAVRAKKYDYATKDNFANLTLM